MTDTATQMAIIALFLTGLSLPSIGSSFHVGGASSLEENRAAAASPPLPTSLAAAREFPKRFDAYWNDAFGFRGPLIRLYSRAKLELGAASTSRVAVGRGPWLFYAGEHSMEIHRGEYPMPVEELDLWRTELEKRSDWMAARGGHYMVVVAPNKESIYGEELAGRSAASGTTRLDQLVRSMSTSSHVTIVDLRGPLLEEKERQRVYSFTDTHWNDHGAYIAYREVSRRLADMYPGIHARPRASFTVRAASPSYGDLARMLGMNELLEEPRDELVPDPPYASTLLALPAPPSPPRPGRHWAFMKGPPDGPRAVVFHDSFFLAPEERAGPAGGGGAAGTAATSTAASKEPSSFRLLALFAEYFSSSVFTWTQDFDYDLVREQNAELVIQEMVERSFCGPP